MGKIAKSSVENDLHQPDYISFFNYHFYISDKNLVGWKFCEFLPEKQTTDSNKYCFQLNHLKAAVDEQKKSILFDLVRSIFDKENAKPLFSGGGRANRQNLFLARSIHQILQLLPFISVFTEFSLFSSLENCIILIE